MFTFVKTVWFKIEKVLLLARENVHRVGVKNYQAAKSNKEDWWVVEKFSIKTDGQFILFAFEATKFDLLNTNIV